MIKSIHDDCPAKQRDRHICAAGSRSDKRIGGSDHAGLVQDPVSCQTLVVADTRKRQEGRPARLFSFQDLDQASCCLFILRDDILYTAAQGDFDRRLVFFLC